MQAKSKETFDKLKAELADKDKKKANNRAGVLCGLRLLLSKAGAAADRARAIHLRHGPYLPYHTLLPSDRISETKMRDPLSNACARAIILGARLRAHTLQTK